MTSCFSTLRFSLTFVIAILALATVVPVVKAAEEVTVELKSGRTFVGFVDSQTSEAKLYLRFEGMATTMWRPIIWESIVGARFQDQDLPIAEFKQLALRIKSKRSRIEPPAQVESASDLPFGGERTMAEQAQQALAQTPTIRSVAIEAVAANWDSDVELDGLLVSVYPLDGYGQIVPAQGSVNLDLIVNRPETVRSKYVYQRGPGFPQIGRWTRQIHTSENSTETAVYRLPFQAAHPEFRYDLAAFGVVHARLVVPGQGVFEASIDLVRVRPLSPTRDNLQQQTGKRFFEGELLGRTR